MNRERLHIVSKVFWTPSNMMDAEREEGFRILDHKMIEAREDDYVYEALVQWEPRREILARGIDKAIDVLGICAQKTFDGRLHQVWEMSESEYNRLCDVPKDKWRDDWGYWRGSSGSNIDHAKVDQFVINGIVINAFDCGKNDDRGVYKDIFEYACEETGASLLSNVTAVLMSVAKINNMRLSTLFEKCYVDEFERMEHEQ